MNPDPAVVPKRLPRLAASGLALALVAGVSYHAVKPLHLTPGEAVAATPPAEPAVPVPVAAVEPRDVVLFDEFSGRLEAVERIDVRARVGGGLRVTVELPARPG